MISMLFARLEEAKTLATAAAEITDTCTVLVLNQAHAHDVKFMQFNAPFWASGNTVCSMDISVRDVIENKR
jgi:hypothetical protein